MFKKEKQKQTNKNLFRSCAGFGSTSGADLCFLLTLRQGLTPDRTLSVMQDHPAICSWLCLLLPYLGHLQFLYTWNPDYCLRRPVCDILSCGPVTLLVHEKAPNRRTLGCRGCAFTQDSRNQTSFCPSISLLL